MSISIPFFHRNRVFSDVDLSRYRNPDHFSSQTEAGSPTASAADLDFSLDTHSSRTHDLTLIHDIIGNSPLLRCRCPAHLVLVSNEFHAVRSGFEYLADAVNITGRRSRCALSFPCSFLPPQQLLERGMRSSSVSPYMKSFLPKPSA